MNAIVRNSPLLARLDEDAIRALIAMGHVRSLGTKETLVLEGYPANHVFLLQGGNARFFRVSENGDDITLLWLAPGDVVGLGCLLAEHVTYLAHAQTVTSCEAFIWDRSQIRSFASSHPSILENGMRISLQYLAESIRRHIDLASKPPAVRLARSLLDLADKVGRVDSSGIEIDITNEHLSTLSDLSPFTVSRLLARWARSGELSKQRGKIILRAPDALIQ
jgi:CRP-like cAMP-binding protein